MNHAKGQADTGHFHAVRFYESPESLCRIVAEFLGTGFITGQPALIIGTPEHNKGIALELRARHFDLDELNEAGNLIFLDARATLATFMVGGHPDKDLFGERMAEVLDQICRGRQDCTVRAYGEMVDLLWKDGATVAAVQLEMLWNKLAGTRSFSLLCGYGMGNFYKDANVEEICSEHSHVIAADGSPAPVHVWRGTVN
jgi:hypothetical protein